MFTINKYRIGSGDLNQFFFSFKEVDSQFHSGVKSEQEPKFLKKFEEKKILELGTNQRLNSN
jgi:hypothetical protein